jgi:tetraacyldisaccharide 4'-kinase
VSWIEARWWADDPAASRASLAALAPAEAAFRAASALRGALYDAGVLAAARVAAPVISVGNLAVGGAGKTPVALAVARRLERRGRTVAILSRGYGGETPGARVVSDGTRVLLGAREAGDEPALLARRLPGARVLCGPRRAEIAGIAIERLGADALVLDDGFQHRALARDLDVVVVDASNPAGNGRLLPRGPNREPWSALRRAGLVWLTRVDAAPAQRLAWLRAEAINATGYAPVESRHAPSDVLDGRLATSLGAGALRGQRALLLCALARPEGFRRTVASLGAEVVAERAFRDHHRFSSAELAEALEAARAAGAVVATTEKDAVRLPEDVAADPLLRVVRIDAEVLAGAAALEDRLAAALAAGDARARTARGEAAR